MSSLGEEVDDEKPAPALHLSDRVMDIVLLFLKFVHAGLNDAFLVLESLLQELVPAKSRVTLTVINNFQ